MSQTIHRHGASADVYMGQLRGKKVAVKKFRIWVTKKEDMTKVLLILVFVDSLG